MKLITSCLRVPCMNAASSSNRFILLFRWKLDLHFSIWTVNDFPSDLIRLFIHFIGKVACLAIPHILIVDLCRHCIRIVLHLTTDRSGRGAALSLTTYCRISPFFSPCDRNVCCLGFMKDEDVQLHAQAKCVYNGENKLVQELLSNNNGKRIQNLK